MWYLIHNDHCEGWTGFSLFCVQILFIYLSTFYGCWESSHYLFWLVLSYIWWRHTINTNGVSEPEVFKSIVHCVWHRESFSLFIYDPDMMKVKTDEKVYLLYLMKASVSVILCLHIYFLNPENRVQKMNVKYILETWFFSSEK